MSLGWHGNAILARDGFDVEAMDRLDLPGLEPRGAVLARCAGLVVVGTHLGLMRSHRLQQMERIREVLANGQYETALIAGDFNEWSEKMLDEFESLTVVETESRSRLVRLTNVTARKDDDSRVYQFLFDADFYFVITPEVIPTMYYLDQDNTIRSEVIE